MQIRLMTTLALFAMTSLATLANAAPDLKDPKQKLSYAIGTGIGANFKKQGVDVDPDVLLAGIKDALAGKQLAMTEAEISTTLNAARADLVAKQQAKQQADACGECECRRRVPRRQRQERRRQNDRVGAAVQSHQTRYGQNARDRRTPSKCITRAR